MTVVPGESNSDALIADRSPSYDELSEELAPWLVTNREHGLRLLHDAQQPRPALEYLAAQKKYHSWLFDEGWLAKGWSPRFGGTGGDALTRAAVYDLLGLAGLEMPTTVNSIEVLAPSLRHFAPQLAAEFMPGLMSGREAWCQGFSEPDAGSDLASLRTRAVQHGDEWIINGQKVWSTRAFGSDRCVVLARTGAPDSRHRGLSMILVDMDTPGIVVRPIADMSGTEHFGEIFFEDVHVPASRFIGAVDQGWEVAQHALQWERGMFGWIRQAALLGLLREFGEAVPEGFEAAYGSAYQDVAALRLRSLATIEALNVGRSHGPQVSIDKLLLSTAELSVQDLLVAAHPVALDDGTPDWNVRLHDLLHSRSAPIYGGSAEIQRTIVAGQILEMRPRR